MKDEKQPSETTRITTRIPASVYRKLQDIVRRRSETTGAHVTLGQVINELVKRQLSEDK